MKALIALTLLSFALPQTPTNVQDNSRLEIAQFSYKQKMIERDVIWFASHTLMVPPGNVPIRTEQFCLRGKESRSWAAASAAPSDWTGSTSRT